MTPIKQHLLEILTEKKVKLTQLARKMGIEHVHFAKMLNGTYISHPKQYVVDRLVGVMELSAGDEKQLREKARCSVRTIILPKNASLDHFELMHLLNDCFLTNQSGKIERVRNILK